MLGQHFVRIGLLGSVGRFAAADRQRFARGTRVVWPCEVWKSAKSSLPPTRPIINPAMARCFAALQSKTTS